MFKQTLLPFRKINFAITALIFSINYLSAGILLTFTYDSSEDETTAAWTGDWDVSSVGDPSTSFNNVATFTGFFYATPNGVSVSSSSDASPTITAVTPWTSNYLQWNSFTGDPFGFDGTRLYGPGNFTSGDTISGSMKITGDFMDIGFSSNEDNQTGSISLGSLGSVDWRTGAAPVPEPHQACLMMGITAVFFCAFSRKRFKSGKNK